MPSNRSRFSRVSRIIWTMAFLAALAMPATQTFADSATDHFNFKGGAPDNGCSGFWVDDTWNLNITVQDNGDGTYAASFDYVGAHFVTRAGVSPGAACEGTHPRGTAVLAGIKGKMNAWLDETITSAIYNPDACGQGAHNDSPCGTRTGFILTVFGPAAIQSDFSYDFEYSSNDKRLVFNYWRESFNSPNYPDGFVGDIATS